MGKRKLGATEQVLVALEAFHLSGTAVVLMNRRGEILEMNRSAEGMLGGAVHVGDRRLVSGNLKASSTLDHAVHSLFGNNPDSLPVQLPRTGRQPLLAYPLKLSSVAANALADGQVLVILVDREKRSRPREASIRNVFGLTEAEARLATRLAFGEAIETASSILGIAKETARTQLKSIYEKTGTHRQSELVALIASLLGQFFLGA